MHDDFDGSELDRSRWLPHYLPAWSSLAASAATYAVQDSCLVLTIPPEQGVWCAGDHEPPLRVSGVQSGNYSGPVGSRFGQQPFRDGQTVKEAQEEFWGWTPATGRVEVVAGMELSARSMASCWMVGREVLPRECAEICVMEVFGDTVEVGRSAEVGCGLHAFRDPDAREDFATTRLEIDVAELHTYTVEWDATAAEFFVDGALIRRCPSPPSYPLMVILAVFDFPERAPQIQHVPRFAVDLVSGS